MQHMHYAYFVESSRSGCTNTKPKEKSWSCNKYVQRGSNMDKLCSSSKWRSKKYCGATCKTFNKITDPNCNDGKLSRIAFIAYRKMQQDFILHF